MSKTPNVNTPSMQAQLDQAEDIGPGYTMEEAWGHLKDNHKRFILNIGLYDTIKEAAEKGGIKYQIYLVAMNSIQPSSVNKKPNWLYKAISLRKPTIESDREVLALFERDMTMREVTRLKKPNLKTVKEARLALESAHKTLRGDAASRATVKPNVDVSGLYEFPQALLDEEAE